MTPLLILVGAYLAGSLPFGLIVARAAKGIDIREHGSKNIGATNVTRVLGWKWGAACFVLDVLKGALPIAFPKMLFALGDPNRVHWLVAAGLLAILGHMFPIWLGFHGGKGVATALGVVVMLANPISTAITFGAFVACFVATRIVSISSITAAVTFVVAQLYFRGRSRSKRKPGASPPSASRCRRSSSSSTAQTSAACCAARNLGLAASHLKSRTKISCRLAAATENLPHEGSADFDLVGQ